MPLSRHHLLIGLATVVAAGCSPLPRETARETALRPSGFDVIRTPKEYAEQVVGQTLLGSGMKVDVEPGGTLSGVYLGERFTGTWVFVEGRSCISLRGDVHLAIDRTCYWVANSEEGIRLFPASYPYDD
ncbi:MAG: hypothetical protein AAGF94_09350 [Pseudomonadota bacterium]